MLDQKALVVDKQGCCKKNDPKNPPVFFLKSPLTKNNRTHQKTHSLLSIEKSTKKYKII